MGIIDLDLPSHFVHLDREFQEIQGVPKLFSDFSYNHQININDASSHAFGWYGKWMWSI